MDQPWAPLASDTGKKTRAQSAGRKLGEERVGDDPEGARESADHTELTGCIYYYCSTHRERRCGVVKKGPDRVLGGKSLHGNSWTRWRAAGILDRDQVINQLRKLPWLVHLSEMMLVLCKLGGKKRT